MIKKNFCEKVLTKFVGTIEQNKSISKKFFYKWGMLPNEVLEKITDKGLHGGVYSKRISLDNLGLLADQTVLNIGPEIGLEVFLLAEKVGKVVVCDPDEDNLDLIRKISETYVLDNGGVASGKLELIPAGINNARTSLREKRMYGAIRKLKKHGLPTYYNVTSVLEIIDLDIGVDVIFIHKILSTISRTDQKSAKSIFEEALFGLLLKLNSGGVLSWTEPEFMFEQNGISSNFFGSIKAEIIRYPVFNGDEFFCQIILRR